VKSSELKWLPEGSQLSAASPAQAGDQQKTFTSFSQSQKGISDKPLGVKQFDDNDITIARLGPGQVALWPISFNTIIMGVLLFLWFHVSIKVFIQMVKGKTVIRWKLQRLI
jgi:hypothetical protein